MLQGKEFFQSGIVQIHRHRMRDGYLNFPQPFLHQVTGAQDNNPIFLTGQEGRHGRGADGFADPHLAYHDDGLLAVPVQSFGRRQDRLFGL